MEQLKRFLFIVICIALCPSFIITEDVDPNPEVDTKNGRVRGTVHYTINSTKPVYTFYSIPYAQAPTGAGRFGKPTPAQSWTGIRNATEIAHACVENGPVVRMMLNTPLALHNRIPMPQRFDIYSEDCLELDVYTPNTTGKLPVLFWIHGGGFYLGTGHAYNGTALCTFTDLVVVSINYRTGHLGFLSSGDEHMPGNMGFFDQVMALKWVKNNIQAFGGDPDRITVAGESAGSWSVSSLLVSPISKDLFKRAILQSGSINTDKLINENPRKKFDGIVKLIGCANETLEDTIQCLRTISIDEISKVGPQFESDWPTIDGEIFPEHPRDLYLKTDFSDKDVLAGVTEDEGFMFLGMPVETGRIPENMNNSYGRFILEIIQGLTSYMREDAITIENIEKIATEYLENNASADTASEELLKETSVDIISDLAMFFPTLNTTRTIKGMGGNTYFYVFSHSPSFAALPRPAYVDSTHFDDVFFMFGVGFLDKWIDEGKGYVFSDAEQELSKQMMQYWANFAATGNPNGDGLHNWPEYDVDNQKYAVIKPNISSSQIDFQKKFNYWKEFMANIEAKRMKVEPETTPEPTQPTGSSNQLSWRYTNIFIYMAVHIFVVLMS
ncbi:unnamed protein product [Owenia fusiformis]|uniref:Carboxylic ester hydrolase n=1 Tax=Owenia fusiformis TaxID=6347 RepID=A0A8J1Y867_OWEFU|nr:unnamed protein product [Owenia fusiformis]